MPTRYKLSDEEAKLNDKNLFEKLVIKKMGSSCVDAVATYPFCMCFGTTKEEAENRAQSIADYLNYYI